MRRFSSTAVAITDPLVKYQTMVTTGLISPDPAQHRLALHLRTLYSRIKDYSPHVDYSRRINQARNLVEPESKTQDATQDSALAIKSHSIWRNPLFKHLLATKEGRDSLALTKVLTNYEAAITIDSPRGLFLSGEVGTGKSMLLDLLAEGLPTERKRRWHFNTFMLHTFAQLEKYRASHQTPSSISPTDYSLLWMAKKLVDESPILFLDEFQLPDRAASKILSHLFIGFFQLGGVLIASSNRMPEDLEKATGIDYTNEPRYGILRKIFGGSHPRSELYGQNSDFSKLLEVLKARCDLWQMDGGQDWRRREQLGSATADAEPVVTDSQMGGIQDLEKGSKSAESPYTYFLPDDTDDSWSNLVKDTIGSSHDAEMMPWVPEDLVVYGRRVYIPKHYNGVTMWDFEQLVQTFGPADYITMASSFHTFIIDKIPVLTVLQKNEARRFITFLDAVYEAKCKLIIRAESPPDTLFFPQKQSSINGTVSGSQVSPEDATYSETIAEVYQDQMSPFRPNISYYDSETATSQYDPDQDSDFGLQKAAPVDFSNSGAFTGEDERFAYKRAASRLWEMCSARWYSRTGNWWQPLPIEARHWEHGTATQPLNSEPFQKAPETNETMGESVEADHVAGLSRYRIEDLQKKEPKLK